MIRVLICDDQSIVCEGLKAIFKPVPSVKVVGVAENGAQALELVPTCQPDLVLMDLKMPIMNGIKATREIRRRFSHIKVLVLTTYDIDDWVFDAIRNGASGYLLKDTPREDLVRAIEGTVEGDTYVSPRVASKLFTRVAQSTTSSDSSVIHNLSEREREVLILIARGFSNNDIADRLHLSVGTIRNYVSVILDKLNVSDRTQAAVLALSSGFVNLNVVDD